MDFVCKFLIIDLRNSFANSWFEILSFLTAGLFHVAKVSDRASVAEQAEVFLSKNL